MPETSEAPDKKLDKIVQHVASIDAFNSITLRSLSKSFLLGMVGAFGATVGLAVVISVLGFFAKEFGGLPFIGKLFVQLGYYLRN